MERLQAGGGLNATTNAYRDARRAARQASDRRLRWQYRRMSRRQLDDAGRIVLRALKLEIEQRGFPT